MKLSVITNTKNEGPRVKATCQAFLGAGADEVIVCADGATDGSCDDLPAGVKVVRNTESLGCGKAKHIATDLASGDALLWVDAHQNVVSGDIREMAKRAIADEGIVTPVLRNIFYDANWHPQLIEGGREFYPNDASILPNCSQQYSFKANSSYAVGVGLCMSRKTYARVGGWNRYNGRHGSQERGVALRAFMAGVSVAVSKDTVLGHEFFGEGHPSRNASTGQYRFNNIAPASYNAWHAFMAVCSPPFFDRVMVPWLNACGLGDGSKAMQSDTAIQDRDYFLRHCKVRPDGDLLNLVTDLVARHSPPKDPGTATLEPMALSYIRANARGRCLECGTGSTGGTRAILEGAKSVVSIDHLLKFTEEAKAKFNDDRATFVHCPRSDDGFYDLTRIEGRFDFVLLDGPPGTQARSRGIQRLLPFLASGGVLLVDDAKRDMQNIEAAKSEFPIRVEMLPTQRGLAKITFDR